MQFYYNVYFKNIFVNVSKLLEKNNISQTLSDIQKSILYNCFI